MSLAREIASLLYHHDCVIVPEFGGFLGQYKPAKLQRELKRILPPGKEISFNSDLTRNDGLLADRIAEAHNLVFAESLQRIKEHVKEWEKELSDSGRLELKGLGTFLRDKQGLLLFQPDLKADFAVASYGLRATAAVPLQQEVLTEKVLEEVPIIQLRPVPVQEKTVEGTTKKKPNGTLRYWGAAASAALLLTAGTLGLVKSDISGSAQFGDLWPFGGDTIPLYEERGSVEETAPTENETQLVAADLKGGLIQLDITADQENKHWVFKEVERSEPVSTYVETAPRPGSYHVVIGCFGVKTNAEKLVAQYQRMGFNARLLDQHRGLFRVTLDSYVVKGEAVDDLRRVRDSGSKDAWLLVK